LRIPTSTLASLLTLLVLPAALTAGSRATFVLADPEGDDHGDGTLKYPLVDTMREGDLDLVEFSAEPDRDGTWFEVKMRRDIRPPGPQVIDAFGRTAAQLAKLGFWELNVDVYVDTDRVAGSGHTATMPGRKLTIDPATAWEKAISLSPRPDQTALLVRRELTARATEEAREDKPHVEQSDLQAATASARELLESDFHFARSVQVTGKRLKFFVPASFLGGPASPDWAYTIVVTGARLEPRFETSSMLGKAGTDEDFLLVPVGTGLSKEHFAGRDDDRLQPPAVDIVVPPGQRQEDVLRGYDRRIGKLAVLTGVVPSKAGAAGAPSR
jgi:hypothetical protein